MDDLRRLAVLTVLMLTMGALVAAQEPAGQRASLSFYPPGPGPKINAITLTFTGRVYDRGAWLKRMAEQKQKLEADEEFLVRVIATNQNGSNTEILELWDPAEKTDIQSSLDNPQESEKNRALFRNIEDTALIAKVYYGQYLFFVVQHSGALIKNVVQVYPIRVSGNKYMLTNRLQDDAMLQFLYFVYGEQIQPRPSDGTKAEEKKASLE